MGGPCDGGDEVFHEPEVENLGGRSGFVSPCQRSMDACIDTIQTETETETQTDPQKHRQTGRQTDRQTATHATQQPSTAQHSTAQRTEPKREA